MAESKRNRKSMTLASEIRENTDIDELNENEKKRLDWETAVGDELQELYIRQIELEERVEIIAENPGLKSPNLNVTRQDAIDLDMNDKVDALTDQINKLIQTHENERRAMFTHINELKAKVKTLETEAQELKRNKERNNLENDDVTMIKEYVNRQIDDLENSQNEKLKMLNDNQSPPTVATATKFKMEIPKFKGTEYERPIKFLNELEKYVTVMKPSGDVLLAIISQALQDNAQSWYYIQQGDINNYDDFVIKFKEQYWNSNMQRNAYRKIELGQFYPGGKFTHVNYAIYIYGLAKELNLNLSEDKLAIKICSHFERSVRHAFNGQSVKDKNTLFNILADFDEDDAKEKTKKQKFAKPNYELKTNQENKEENKTRTYENKFKKSTYATNTINYDKKQAPKKPEQYLGPNNKNKGAIRKYPPTTTHKTVGKISEELDPTKIKINEEDGAWALPKNG